MPKTTQRCILLIDIRSFGRREWDDQTLYRQVRVLRRLMRGVLRSTRLDSARIRRRSTGDGMLYLFEVEDRGVVLEAVAALARKLSAHNQQVEEARRIELRVVVDSGQLKVGRTFETGGALIEASRMLNSDTLHEQLESIPEALALMVPDHIYGQVVSRGYCRSYRAADFEQVEVQPTAKYGTPPRAWVLSKGWEPPAQHARPAPRSARTPAAARARALTTAAWDATAWFTWWHLHPRRGVLRWVALGMVLGFAMGYLVLVRWLSLSG